MDITTITLSKGLKSKIENLKRYHREPLRDAIARLLSDREKR